MIIRGAIPVALRLTVIVLGAVLATSATLRAASSYWRQDADHAPLLLRTSPALRLAEAEAHRIKPGWLVEHAAAVRDNAREVLRRAPLDAVALRQLAELEPDSPGKGLQLLRLSERVTRREPISQILLVNAEAGANNNAQALVHYDRALTIWPQLGTTLLPVLASGLSNPALVEQLSRFADRPWFRPLLGTGLERGAPVPAVAKLAESARVRLPANERQSLSAELIGKLLALNRHDDIRAFVMSLGGPERMILDDLAINRATTDSRNLPLSWRMTSDVAISSEFVPPSGMRVTVSPSSSGVAAGRLTLLQPGSYTLLMRFGYDPGAPRATLRWALECDDGRTIWRTDLASDRTSASYSTQIVVPQGCNQQSWRLDAGADDSQFASIARIDSLSLRDP